MTIDLAASHPIRRVLVLGTGTMGQGIAQISALAGYVTHLYDVDAGRVEKAVESIKHVTDRLVQKGKMLNEARSEMIGLLVATPELARAAEGIDLVIEAVPEVMNLKVEILSKVKLFAPAHTIFASNTSSLTIAAMAAACGRPDKMLGLHFFNPVPLMKLVEVVRTITTSDETADTAFEFAKKLGKEPVRAKDSSGFVVNLLLVPYMLDAINALEANVASVEDIDKAMQLGAGHPMGPFTLLDFVGLDTTYKIAEIMFDEYREKRYAPPPLLKRMVIAGMFGRKSGKGFYDYSQDPPRVNQLGL
jgi:3-hydroxybutyryl-CoA dehydrogenase